jgi:repressor of nif and glnA expression
VRGRKSNNYFYLEPEILKILKTSNVPISALGINFRLNNSLGKIIDLNTIKSHLGELVENNKILEIEKDEILHYKINPKVRIK